MTSRFVHLADPFTARFSIAPLARLSRYIGTMRPGDKLVLTVLGIMLAATSLLGTYALMRTFLIEVPAYGGSLTEGIVGSPRFVNPLLALTDADRDVTALVYAGLMGVGPDGALVPVLAESYEISEDGTVYTFTLRADARFSDGSPVTADDVAFTIEKAQDPALKSPEYANWSNVRAESVDARTVRFTLPKAYAPFIEDTTLGILPARLWRNVADKDFPFSPLMTKPVGAGPFKVAAVGTDSAGAIRSYDLVAASTYAPGRPYLDRIRLKFYDDQADVLAAYRRHAIESAPGVSVAGALSAPYARVFGVFFNERDTPAFKERAVRKALSLAIDRGGITDTILGGHATPLSGPVPPGSDVAVPEAAQSAQADAAKQALVDGGFAFDEETGIWENAEEDIALDSVTLTTSNVPELRTVAAAIQADWAAIGVPTQIEVHEPGDLAQQVIRPRAFDALYFGMVIGRGQDLYAFWDSAEREDPGLNITGYSDDEADALLAKARTERDPAAMRESLAEAAALIAADYPAAFTHAPDFLYAVPNNLKGVHLPQIAAPRDRFATVATWYRQQAYVWPFLVGSR